MALKVCSTALDQGGYHCDVGQVFDSTHFIPSRYPTFFSDAVTFKDNVVNTGGVYATPIVLTAAQSGSTILLNDAAGLDFTLPAIAAADVGVWYRFVATVSVSSNNYRWTAQTGDLLLGGVNMVDFDAAYTAPQGVFLEPNGTTHLVCTMNGGTTGGKIGTDVMFHAVSATGWTVTGTVGGDGVLATPFS